MELIFAPIIAAMALIVAAFVVIMSGLGVIFLGLGILLAAMLPFMVVAAVGWAMWFVGTAIYRRLNDDEGVQHKQE